MYTLLVTAAVVSVAVADVSHLGYQYQVPHTSYGVPAYQYGNKNNYNGGYNTGSASGSSYTTGHGGYQGAGFGQQNAGGQSGYHTLRQLNSGGQGGFSGVGSGHQNSGEYQHSGSNVESGAFQTTFGSSSGFSGGFQPSSQSHGSASVTVHQAPAQVFKHVYVHEAPEDHEPVRPRQQLVLPPPQKHYKIIFIKTPSSVVYEPKYIPVPQQNEEKTIVYLLTKKAEEQHDEIIPQLETKPPAKPEVFFVKYQNKEDSQAVINNIVQEHSKDGSAVFASGLDGVSSGYIPQNGNSGQYTQHGSGSGSGSYGIQNDSGSGAYGEGQHKQSVQYGGSSQYSQTSGGPYTGENSASFGPAVSTGAASSYHGGSSFDGTVDTITTSQGVPHTSYTKFRD